MQEGDENMPAPAWLESMLKTQFFASCLHHGAAAKSECNMFCLNCKGDAFCAYCRSATHVGHQVIQIRRSSYRDVVRVAEIQTALDIKEVQTYVINSARVLFLKERPQPKSSKGPGHACKICGRNLLDSFSFCSLECKLVGIKRECGESLTPEEELRVRSQQERFPPPPATASPPTSNARRRKGIPRRASFGF